MRRAIAAIALACLLAGGASAAQWTVDQANSKLGFRFAFSGQPVEGRFKTWSADIDFDPADFAHAHAKVSIDLNSPDTGDESRDSALPGDVWFAAASNPQAVFDTTAFRSKGGDAYEADGTLTMRGVAKPVTLPFTLKIDGKTAKMDGTVTIDRTQWGVGQGQYAGDDPIATKVDVIVSLTATSP